MNQTTADAATVIDKAIAEIDRLRMENARLKGDDPLARPLFRVNFPATFGQLRGHDARHSHICRCGAELTCTGDFDHCAVPSDFECPTCELDRLDHQMDEQEIHRADVCERE